MNQTLANLGVGLLLAILVIFLLLSANFQSLRLGFVVLSTVPAVLSGVAISLWVTGTTLNIQSFMGAIMAEEFRRAGATSVEAAVHGAVTRMRPILMTVMAMTAGMIPMALALGAGAEETAPLGRAVIGGLLAATIATLTILPFVFSIVQGRAGRQSPSLDPEDPQSAYADR